MTYKEKMDIFLRDTKENLELIKSKIEKNKDNMNPTDYFTATLYLVATIKRIEALNEEEE